MKTLIRILVLALLLIAAIFAYSAGSRTGMFIFIILGFALEAAFWLGIFPIKRKKQ